MLLDFVSSHCAISALRAAASRFHSLQFWSINLPGRICIRDSSHNTLIYDQSTLGSNGGGRGGGGGGVWAGAGARLITLKFGFPPRSLSLSSTLELFRIFVSFVSNEFPYLHYKIKSCLCFIGQKNVMCESSNLDPLGVVF